MKKFLILLLALSLLLCLGVTALAAEEAAEPAEPAADGSSTLEHKWKCVVEAASNTGNNYTVATMSCVLDHNCGLGGTVTITKPSLATGYAATVAVNFVPGTDSYVTVHPLQYSDGTNRQDEPFLTPTSGDKKYIASVTIQWSPVDTSDPEDVGYHLPGVQYALPSVIKFSLSETYRLSAIEYTASNSVGTSVGEFQLNAPTLTTYNGNGSAAATHTDHMAAPASVTVKSTSYEGVNGTEYGPSSTAPTKAGSYKVTMTVTAGDGKDYTLSRSYTIDKAGFNIGVSGLPRRFDYINETVTVDTGTGTAEPVIILRPQQADNKHAPDTSITLENGACISDYTGMQMFYIVTASDNYKASNTYHTFQVPARPAAPVGLAGTDECFDGFDDGKITGVTSRMEYKLQGAESWTAAPENASQITGLADGTYLVRYKAVADSSFASEAATVTIARGVVPTYTLTASALDFGTVTYTSYVHTAKPLTIISSGNRDATITGFEVSGDFEKYSTGDSVITAGSTNTSWMVRPKAGLTVADSPYTGTVTITYNDGATATAGLYVSIEKARAPIYASAPVFIDYEQETIHVGRYVDAIEPVYAINSQVEDNEAQGTQIENGGSITDYIGTTIYYKAVESDNYKADPTWSSWQIPARPDAPTSPAKQADESIEGYCDGSITGLDSTMEYKLQGAESWTPAPENASQITGLASGTYLVRYKATDSAFASETAEVTVAKGVPPVYDFAFSGGCFDTFYNSAWARPLTITNTGNMPLSNARLSVEGTDAEKMFRIGEKTADLAVGQSGEWSQSYVGQMNVGSYDLTLVVTADNNVRIEKEITFVIRQNSQLPPEHHTLQYPWGQDWIAYEKCESSYGAPIEYSFDGGQTWITGTPDPEDPNRLIIRGLTPDTHYSVDFRYGPSPDGNYAPSEKYVGMASFGFTTMHGVGVTQGGGQTFYLGSDEDLLFVSSDKFEHFRYLYVYPKGADMSTVDVLDRSFYMVEEGSVRLTLKAEYLNSLPVGEYVIEIPCNDRLGDGEAVASFFVKEMPAGGGSNGGDTEGEVVKTGDSRQAGLWAALLVVCAAAAAALLIAKKKKRH